MRLSENPVFGAYDLTVQFDASMRSCLVKAIFLDVSIFALFRQSHNNYYYILDWINNAGVKSNI
jgi:hypothetical protein